MKTRKSPTKYTKEQKDQAIELRKEGKTLISIANQINVEQSVLGKWVHHIKLSKEQKTSIWDNRKITNHKYIYNTFLFENPNKIIYYILGCFITDGCVSQDRTRANIVSNDKEWLEKIRLHICQNLEIKNKTDKCYVMDLFNKQIVSWFIANECIPKKSLIVKFPQIPEEFLFHFLRGVVDGDGCIRYDVSTSGGTTRRLKVTIVSGSKEFSESLSNILHKYEIKNFVNKYLPKEGRLIKGKVVKTNNPVYTTFICNSSAIKFCELLYQDSDGLFLQRKYDKFQEYMICRKEDQEKIQKRKEESLNLTNKIIELLKTNSKKEIAKILGIPIATVYRRIKFNKETPTPE